MTLGLCSETIFFSHLMQCFVHLLNNFLISYYDTLLFHSSDTLLMHYSENTAFLFSVQHCRDAETDYACCTYQENKLCNPTVASLLAILCAVQNMQNTSQECNIQFSLVAPAISLPDVGLQLVHLVFAAFFSSLMTPWWCFEMTSSVVMYF